MIAAGFSHSLHRNREVHENSSATGLIDPSDFRDGVRDMGCSSLMVTITEVPLLNDPHVHWPDRLK